MSNPDRSAPRESPRLRFIAWLLGLANAHPGLSTRSDFYALKDRLLSKYGRRAGTDVQRIVDRCWGYEQWGCEGEDCRRCDGTGVWRERRVLLDRWEIGGRIFHRPVGSAYGRALAVTVEGRIRHPDTHPRTSGEAQLWLALLFDRRLFWRTLSTSRFCGWQWRPMLALQSLVFETRMLAGRFTPRECSACRRPFIRPFARGYWFVCRRCASIPALAFGGDDDLPF